MKQIYNFEASEPPVCNEDLLKAELKKRQLRRQTTLAAVSGILTQLVLLLCALLLADTSPILAIGCVAYVIFSATGGTILAILLHSGTGKRALQQA